MTIFFYISHEVITKHMLILKSSTLCTIEAPYFYLA